jgi:DNA-binding HxlR family transcriptional regulator
MTKQPIGPVSCPIDCGLEIFGDRWTLLIIRELLFHRHATYRHFSQIEEGISTGVLANRIAKLLERGIIMRRQNAKDARSADYYLTAKGKALEPILVEMVIWTVDHEMPEIPCEEMMRVRNTKRLMPDETDAT